MVIIGLKGIKGPAFWRDWRKNRSHYLKARKTVLRELDIARSYGDWMAIQRLNKEFVWLEAIFEIEYKKAKLKEANGILAERERYIPPSDMQKFILQNVDGKEVAYDVMLNFKKRDVLAPGIFDLENEWHQHYVFEISRYFEVTVGKCRSGEVEYLEYNLEIDKHLTSMALNCVIKLIESRIIDDWLEVDYLRELKEELEFFK
jgi:hypothetical protein